MRVVVLLAVALLAGGLCACGGKTRTGAATTVTTAVQQRAPAGDGGPADADGDRDSHPGSLYDRDDRWAFRYGRAASVAAKRDIASIVLRYYAAAAAGSGAGACPLVYSLVAEDLAEERGHVLGPSGLPSPVCAEVLSGLFREQRRRFARDAKLIRVVDVRLHAPHALALLSIGDGPLRHIWLHAEGGAWKIEEFWDDGME